MVKICMHLYSCFCIVRRSACHWQSGNLLRICIVLQEPIATEVEEVSNYYTAEDYHQQYLSKGGRFGNAQSAQKGCSDPIRCYG